jgi:hypothetical protein
MQEFMTEERVKHMVSIKGTQFVTVTFVKADGSVRVVNGLFKPSSKIVGSERGQMQGEAMAKRNQIPVYELATKHWKSFYADKVLGIV